MSEEEVQEVEAEVIEAPVPATEIDRAVARAAERAATWGERFQPRKPRDYDDYRQAKRERAALRREIKEITDARKGLFAPWKEAIRDGETRINDVIEAGRRADAEYKAGLDAYDADVVGFHLGELRKAYEEYAPDLAALVPFERIDAKWGQGKGWHKASANQVEMERQMRVVASEIAHNERVILDGHEPDEDKERWRSEYFRTLDFVGAARVAQEAREARERTRRLDEEREAREAYARERAAQAEPHVPDEPPLPAEAEPEYEVPQRPQAPARQRPAQTPGDATGDAPGRATASVGASQDECEYWLVWFPRGSHGQAMAALRGIPGSHGRKVRKGDVR